MTFPTIILALQPCTLERMPTWRQVLDPATGMKTSICWRNQKHVSSSKVLSLLLVFRSLLYIICKKLLLQFDTLLLRD